MIKNDEGYEVIEPTWGFIPLWAKDKKRKPINARGETVATNGMFKLAFNRKRCLVPANSYYEWVAPDQSSPLQSKRNEYQSPAGLFSSIGRNIGPAVRSCTLRCIA